MNKFLSAIYRNDHHSLDVYIERRTGKDRHDINEALQILIGDTDLNKKQRIHWIQTLLLADANPNGKDANGNPYLLTTCEIQDTEISHLLVNFECDVNASNEDGTTPLHMVAKVGNVELAGLLLASGADVNAVDSIGETPLIRALYFHPEEELFSLLLIDAKINVGNEDFETALHIAVHMNMVKEARMLIDNGANVNLEDNCGNIPLHCACQLSSQVPNMEMLQLLIDSNSNINAVTRYHNLTPLHMLATRKMGTAAVELLLQCPGIDLEVRNDIQQTPLFAAVHCKALDNVKVLLKANCDPNVSCFSTQFGLSIPNSCSQVTVLDLAISLADANIVCSLLIAGATKSDKYSMAEIQRFLTAEIVKEKVREISVLLNTPQPLKQITRISIRKALGKNTDIKIFTLESLPSSLQHYLALTELDMYPNDVDVDLDDLE